MVSKAVVYFKDFTSGWLQVIGRHMYWNGLSEAAHEWRIVVPDREHTDPCTSVSHKAANRVEFTLQEISQCPPSANENKIENKIRREQR